MVRKIKKEIAFFALYAFWVLVLSMCSASISGCSTGDENSEIIPVETIVSPTPEEMPHLPMDPEPTQTPTDDNETTANSITVKIDQDGNTFLIFNNNTIGINQIADIIKNDFNNKYEFNVQTENNQKYYIGNYWWGIYWDWGYVGGCIKKNVHHLNFILNNSTISNKPIIDVHICFWWDNGPQIGVYNSGQDKFCFTSEGTFTAFKEKLQNLIIKCAPTMPIAIAATIATIIAYIVITCIPVAFAANNENIGESPDDSDTEINPINTYPVPILPNPNIINPEATPEPSPPPPEPGVIDAFRTTDVSCGVDEFEGATYYIHKGSGNKKMYVAKRDKFGNWSDWKELEGETNDAPDICIWRGKIVVVHRALTGGTIYAGMMNIDFTNWSGWKSTGRNSKFAPVLASDKGNIALVHDGGSNAKIYYNTDFNNWFNNGNWKETPRTSHARVGAAMYQGVLWIVHLGYGETRIYIGNVIDNKWDYTQRDSRMTPALAIIKSKRIMGIQGLDGKNYIGDPYDPTNWPPAKEVTSCAPSMCALQDNMICYAFVNIYSLRSQIYITNTPQPPAPETGVEEIGRTSGLSWSFAEFIFNRKKLLAGIHIGANRDGLPYVGIRDAGIWDNWNPALPWAWTDKPASIVVYKNKFVIAYTDAVNNIWIGEMNLDKTGWTGWYSTGRSSTHGAVLATDGSSYIYLVHKGNTNNIIYYNSDYSNWFDNGNWKESGRSTNVRFGAFVNRGKLYIVHVGEDETKIYYGNVQDNVWKYCGRDTTSGPTIAVKNGIEWIGHRGLTDNKNYVLNTSTGIVYILKERTQDQPHLGIHNGILKYGYVYNDFMRMQNVP